MWYSGSGVPNSSSQAYVEGDMYLQSNGQVYRYQSGRWQAVVNIKGPRGIQGIQGPKGDTGAQGPQGPQGERGDVGGFINIKGILSNVDQLPLPSSLNNLTVAYLVGSASPYDLYIQVGSTSEDAVWTNTGPFNAATLVMVNGVGQNVWNADTKVGFTDYASTDGTVAGLLAVNKSKGIARANLSPTLEIVPADKTDIPKKISVKPITPSNLDYAVKVGITTNTETLTDEEKQAVASWIGVQAQNIPNTLVQRYNSGNIAVPLVPTANVHATSKDYVDNNFVAKPTTTSGYNRVIGVDTSNNSISFVIQYPNYVFDEVSAPSRNGIAAYWNGNIGCAMPLNDYHATPKKYVDNKVAGIFTLDGTTLTITTT